MHRTIDFEGLKINLCANCHLDELPKYDSRQITLSSVTVCDLTISVGKIDITEEVSDSFYGYCMDYMASEYYDELDELEKEVTT